MCEGKKWEIFWLVHVVVNFRDMATLCDIFLLGKQKRGGSDTESLRNSVVESFSTFFFVASHGFYFYKRLIRIHSVKW